MSREKILEYFKDINHAYNDCTRYDTLKHMLDELQEPCEDCISRQAAIDACLNGWNKDYKEIVEEIRALPPVTPQYTDTEIQKMQDLEFAEIQKAYEIGKDEGSEVLDKIRAEMEQIKEAEYQIYGKGSWRFVDKCLEIIDKYKASPTGEDSTCDACETPCVMYEKGMRGCNPTGAEVLDKIRAEIIELRSRQNVGVLECLDIIDKYKASPTGGERSEE